MRAVLALFVVGAYGQFRAAVRRVYGSSIANWMAALTAVQFHFLFYASRPLPNTFALVLGTHA